MHNHRLFKLAMVAALIIGVMAVGLLGNPASRALAQDAQPQTYIVQAGAFSAGNAELLAFAPSEIKVHRGDTVSWAINSFHDVHFETVAIDLVIVADVNGTPTPQFNSAVAFPTIANGDTYTGGDVNSGLPLDPGAPPLFSLVMDLAPGRYFYFCDVHPGMVGVIEVVDSGTAIPTPSEAAAAGQQEIAKQFGVSAAAVPDIASSAPVMSTDGNLTVSISSGGTGRVFLGQFFTPVGVIHAGESVTWANATDSIDLHFINSAPFDPNVLTEIIPVQVADNAPPVLTLGPGFLGTTPDGATIASGETFNSTGILPGQSYTLTFQDPGVFPYLCHIHPGMQGVIVVQPAM